MAGPVLDIKGAPDRAPAAGASSARGPRVVGALGVVAVLFLLRATAPTELALGNALQDTLTLAISVVVESLPFVVLGICLSIVVQLWLPQWLLLRLLPRTPVLRRATLSTLGVLLPVCECGNVPLARGLVSRGVPLADAMTFLLAAPILNPITIVTTYQAFGFSDGILVLRVVGGFVIANLVGWLFSRHPQPESLLTDRFQDYCSRHDHVQQREKPVEALRLFVAEAQTMVPALFVGAGVAGGIQAFAGRNLLLTLGRNPLWSVLALMALAFVIAICSTVDAFFILSFASVFTPGAIVAFLVLGPMVDVKMLVLLRTTFTAKTLVLLTSLVVLCTAVLGLGVNLVG